MLKKAQTNNKISSFIFVENGVKNQDDKHSKCIDNVTHVSTEGIFDSSLFSISCASKEKVYMKACNKDIVSELSPVGRLKSRYGKWADITSNGFILSVIEDGYKIPFKEMPESVDLKNNKTARDSMEFVKSEVNKLLENSCAVEVKDKPIVINPLTVATNKVGKQGLVLDCRHLNKCLQKFKFKYEDAIVARRLFEKGTYLFSFDLRSAYHHIDIFSQHRTYLGFKLIEGETTKYFIFRSLPFGLATAGFIFNKLVRVVVQYWRSAGHQVEMFLDDGIGGNTNRDKAVKSSKFIKGTLYDLGFLIAEDKCKWDPVLQAVWLGYFWNMVEGKLYVTDERVSRLEKSLQSLLSTVNACKVNLVRVRFLACIVGQVISMQAVFGKIVQLNTRSLYKCIQSKASWDTPVSLTAEGIKELEYWKQNVRAVNQKGQTISPNLDAEIYMFTDASSVGYGGYVSHKGVSGTKSLMSSGEAD